MQQTVHHIHSLNPILEWSKSVFKLLAFYSSKPNNWLTTLETEIRDGPLIRQLDWNNKGKEGKYMLRRAKDQGQLHHNGEQRNCVRHSHNSKKSSK